MSPDEIRTELDGLRAAGETLRRRPAAEVQGLLEQVLDGWSDRDSGWRQQLEASLPTATGFSPEVVAEGLERGLAHWDGAALRALVARELGDVGVLDGSSARLAAGFDVTALLLAGSIPMPSLLALIAPLVLRSPVLAKTASRDAVTAPLVVASLAEIDAELGACAAAFGFAGDDDDAVDALLEADCVVAMGGDATIANVARRIAPATRLVAYGHRLSVAAVGGEATRGESLKRAADALATDVALWDQLGCLSPVAVYAVGEDPDAADRVAAALAQALASAELRWPRGRVDAEVAAGIVLERDAAELRGAADGRVAVHASDGTAWTVVRERDATPRDAPLHRFVRVHPVADEAALLRALLPFRRHLAAVAIAGFGTASDALALALAQRGASRICAPGTLQAPPLDWRHEGRGVLTPLARFADREAW